MHLHQDIVEIGDSGTVNMRTKDIPSFQVIDIGGEGVAEA